MVELQKAKFWNDYWQGELQGAYLSLQQNPNSDARRIHYEDMGARAAEANANYLRIQQEAANNLNAARRSLLSAQQAYQSALESYNDLKDSDPVKEAELAVLQAETKLMQAQLDLTNATLTAPISGTVTALTLEAGKSAGSASITLADLDSPLVRFWVEETDLGSVLVGNKVNITLESMPDRIFTGKIVRVDPALVSVGNTQAVQAWASVDRPAQPTQFFSNMSAEVEVIAQETRNALLVPVQALRELAPGQNAVFVVKADGKLELRLVQVGLKDFVSAEVFSGINPGEVVSLGTAARTIQTTRTQAQNRNNQPPGDFGPFPGGGIR
jgi:RND family efflux transporter MFP subunit